MSDDPIQPVAPITAVSAVTPAPARRTSSGRTLNVLLAIAAAVAIGGVAFAVGRGTAPAATALGRGNLGPGVGLPGASFVPGASGAPGQGGPGGFIGRGGLTIRGTVQSVDGDTLTIETDTGTIDVTIGTDTGYHTQAAASAADVIAGATVSVSLDLGAGGPGGGTTDGPIGTASDVTVIP